VRAKNSAILVLSGFCFCTLMLYFLVGQHRFNDLNQSRSETKAPLHFSGLLRINSMSDFRVGSRKIILCGVSFTKPRQMENIIIERARHDFQGKSLNCKQVGGGTPCDGRAATAFRDAIVAQCFSANQEDIATQMSQRGFLCDLPAQSGGAYVSC